MSDLEAVCDLLRTLDDHERAGRDADAEDVRCEMDRRWPLLTEEERGTVARLSEELKRGRTD